MNFVRSAPAPLCEFGNGQVEFLVNFPNKRGTNAVDDSVQVQENSSTKSRPTWTHQLCTAPTQEKQHLSEQCSELIQ